VSPSATALRIQVGPDEDEQTSARVQLASQWEAELEANRRDRRVHRRHRAEELQWLRSARLGAGQAVSIVDLSVGGALLDSPVPLRPDSFLTLDIVGRGFDKSIPFRVVRCQIGSLRPERTLYRGACEFTALIELPVDPSGAKVLYSDAFVSLDVALKQLVERAGPAVDADGAAGPFGVLDARKVCSALESLRERAIKSPLDPMSHPLAALIGQVVPALECYRGLQDVIGKIESQVRQTIPQVSLRLVEPNVPSAPGKKSILINVPGATIASALVSVDLPRGFVLNDWQARVLRVASRLIALLQRLEPAAIVTVPENRASDPASPQLTTANLDGASTPQAIKSSAWQKIVVRYREGQILKGFTHDFNPARPQFSLWPTVNAAPRERVIVPLARLKGVFFVRDFAGNPGYVERTDSTGPQHGRRIEVTLLDDEVIVGRTLSYRADGHGFFVNPADTLANNIRIFVVASAVRQVRFP
jgi:PilZ domain